MFRLVHSEFLYGLLCVPLFVFLFLLMMRWKKKSLLIFGETSLLKQLLPDVSDVKKIWKFIILSFSFVFLLFGIISPQIGTKLEEIKREGIDIIIALDVSNSMKAEDIKPSRMERAKQAISKLIDKLQNDRIGIIVFAGEAYTQLPLTTDYGAAKLFTSTIDCDMIPTQGTAIGAAIELAVKSFSSGEKEDKKHKALLIITDGENHEDDAFTAAKNAAETGIIIHTIGMGSPDGAPIPVYNGNAQVGFRKDNEGNTVVTKLDETMLQQIAGAGNGKFVRANNAEDGMEAILNDINKMEKKQFGTKMYTDYEDRFQYFLGFALLLLVTEIFISERKSKWLEKIKLFST